MPQDFNHPPLRVEVGAPSAAVEETPSSNIAPKVAAERAFQESLVLNDAAAVPQLLERNLNANVVDEAVTSIYSELMTKELQSGFEQEIMSAESDEEKLKVVNDYYAFISRKDARTRTVSLMAYLNSFDPENYSMDNYEKFRYVLTPRDMDMLRRSISEKGIANLEKMMAYGVSDLDQDTVLDVAISLGQQVGIPLQEFGLNRLVEQAGVPIETSHVFSGSVRQEIREYLTGLSEAELLETVAKIDMAFKRAEADPFLGKLLSDFNIVDFWMEVLNDQTLIGRDPTNKLDTWLSNIATALDGLAMVGVVSNVPKPLQRTLTQGTPGNTGAVIDAIGSSRGGRLKEAMEQTPVLRETFGVQEVDMITSRIPKPAQLLDEIAIRPEVHVDDLEELAQGYVFRTGDATRRAVPLEAKVNTVDQELRAIANVGTPTIRVSPTTIKLFDDESGFTINTILGASENSGYKALSEAVETAQKLDPLGLNVEILQYNYAGVLTPVYKGRDGILNAFKDLDVLRKLDESYEPAPISTATEYFVRYKQDRPFHSVDAQLFGPTPTLRSGGIGELVRPFTPLSWRVDQRLSQSAIANYALEQKLVATSERILQPFYKLGAKDRQIVMETFEWTEEFARKNGRPPIASEIYSQYPDLTPKQFRGRIALREAMDAFYAGFNSRLYRDWKANGFITAHIDDGVTFHGKPLEFGEANVNRNVFDPITNEGINITKEELEELYAAGGRVIKLDMPYDVPRASSNKFTRIKIDPRQGYELRSLDTNPLKYSPGYTPRMYDDPYLIVKEYRDGAISIDGQVRRKVSPEDPDFNSVIRTAPSYAEGRNLVTNINRRLAQRGTASKYTYKLVRARNLGVQERVAAVNQLMYREGRLFWDKRSPRPLKNLEGNVASMLDPVEAIERASALVARQTTQEDWLRSVKESFFSTYRDILDRRLEINGDSRDIKEFLKNYRDKTTDKVLRTKAQNALDLWNWVRMLEGVNSDFFASMRAWLLSKAQGLNHIIGNKGARALERGVLEAQPLNFARSAVFKTFMALRPVRQLVLQSAQIAFLAPLDPKYVGSGKVFLDALGLRRSLAHLHGLDTGITDSKIAKLAGYSPADWNALVTNFSRSGLIETVDVHSFVGGARKWHKIRAAQNAADAVYIGAKKVIMGGIDIMQRYGFDLGESNNLTFTYLLATRKYMKENNISAIKNINVDQWDEIFANTSNMALGMVRPSQFGYQSGVLSLATQFLSFGHKAMLTMVGANPAIKPLDAAKIVGGMYLLYGFNIFGMKDWIYDWVNKNGGKDLPNEAKDLLTGGAIDFAVNKIFEATIDDWKDLDVGGTLAPGPNYSMLYRQWIEGVMQDPIYTKILGPSYTVGSKVLQGVKFVEMMRDGEPDLSPAEKFRRGADQIAQGLVPFYNDTMQSYVAWKMGQWYTAADKPTGLRPTWNTLIARGLLGVRSEEELETWALRDIDMDWQNELDKHVKDVQDYMRTSLNMYDNGELSYQGMVDRISIVRNFMEDIPEEYLRPWLERVMGIGEEEGIFEQISQMIAKGIADPNLSSRAQNIELTDEQRQQIDLLIHMLQKDMDSYRSGMDKELQNREELYAE